MRPTFLELAENANTYTPLGPGSERVVEPGYVIWFGETDHPSATVVQRLRLDAGRLDAQVAEIHAEVAARGRRACTWEIAGSATPADLCERLLARGLALDGDPHVIGMALTHVPDGLPSPGVTVRKAETLEDRIAATRIASTAFGDDEDWLAGRVEQLRAADAAGLVDETSSTYLALLDGEPVASGIATFTEAGALLFGGASLPGARGRGAYRALVRARWDEAVARGTPALVTHAGRMSQPILLRLGFEPVSKLTILLDETVPAVG